MYKKFNINKSVKVKLTRHGIAVYKEHYANIGLTDVTINIDDEGYSKFQMHDLMSIFGSSMYMGGNLPFQTEILIEESPRKEEVKKLEKEMTLSIGNGGIRMENINGGSLHLYDYLKTIPNVKKGDIAFNQTGYYKFDGEHWNEIILGDLDV